MAISHSKKDYKLVGFSQGPRNKKYSAILQNKRTGKFVMVHFGDKSYQQYRDSTGLGLYSGLDHGDKKRRALYRIRHANDNKDTYSPGFFSWKYLW